MVYVLHYAPDNASLIVRLALEELGLPYQTVLVDRAVWAQERASYRALNPAGLIPVLETQVGPLFETAAILLWLSEQHGRMAPQPGDTTRGHFLKWLFFTSNTVHAQLRLLFYPEKYVGDDAAAQACLRHHITSHAPPTITLPAALHLLDTYIAEQQEWTDPTMLDCYIAAILRWCAVYPAGHTAWFDIHNWPALHARVEAMEARASTHAAQIAEGLGPTPFTAPQRPNPPEGVAL